MVKTARVRQPHQQDHRNVWTTRDPATSLVLGVGRGQLVHCSEEGTQLLRGVCGVHPVAQVEDHWVGAKVLQHETHVLADAGCWGVQGAGVKVTLQHLPTLHHRAEQGFKEAR